MSDDDYRYLASLSAEEHLRNAVLPIQHIYAEELKRNKETPKEIVFDSI
ncbi:MAG: hypothetical protein ACOVP1_05415 [Bacteroidia bacterium]